MRILLASLLMFAPAAASPAAPRGELPAQPLVEPSPQVDGAGFAARLLSPLSARDVARFLAHEGRTLAGESFTPGEQAVDLYVPANEPPAGYGLLVFVPPMDQFAIPRDWKTELERRGIVLAMLRGAGNEADVFGRRIPLVLHARHHVARHYRIDPARTWVGGFSGGARLAQRVALAWPDLFTGSLQFAGSVLVGENLMPPPARELMALARTRSRFVLASGSLDGPNRRNDAKARERLEALCFASVRTLVPSRLEHWVPDRRGFARALDLLEAPAAPASGECERALDTALAAELDAVQARLEHGDAVAARDALVALDDRYGGLLAPRSLALAARIEQALGAGD